MGGYEWGYGGRGYEGGGGGYGVGRGLNGCFYVCVLFLICLRTDYL